MICPFCAREIKHGTPCLPHGLQSSAGARIILAIPWSGSGCCPDCGSPAFHHEACDQAKCPHCGGQAISCGCYDDGDDDGGGITAEAA